MDSSPSAILTTPRLRSQGRPGLNVPVWVLSSCVAVLLATYMVFVEPPPPQDCDRDGGPERCLLPVRAEIREGLAKEGLTVEVRETGGLGREPPLAGGRQLPGWRPPSFRAVWPVPRSCSAFRPWEASTAEPLRVFYRGEKPLNSLSQLAGKRINVGPISGGTHAIAVPVARGECPG